MGYDDPFGEPNSYDEAKRELEELAGWIKKQRSASPIVWRVREAFLKGYLAGSRWEPETVATDYDPTDEEQGPLEQGWAASRRYDLEHKEDRDG